MACVKPEPLHLVVYMHIPLCGFPKPDKQLWRTPEGRYGRCFDGAKAMVRRLIEATPRWGIEQGYGRPVWGE